MNKKILLSLASLVVVAGIAVGGTLAFMTNKTQVMTNSFKAAPGLTGELREPKWDGYNFGEKNGNNDPDGTSVKTGLTDDAKAALGYTKAQTATPGLNIPKNPTLKNTSSVPVYMAIRVDYSDKEIFDKAATLLGLNKTDWTEHTIDDNANAIIYVYNTTVAADSPTNPLFDGIQINAELTTDQLTEYLTGLNIKVTGGAVQSTDIKSDVAANQLVDLLK